MKKPSLSKAISTILITILYSNIFAQVGVSTGSFSAAKNNHNINSQHIFIEDFMNYHKHQITIPKTKDVAISIDYDNTISNSDTEFILQIGIATQEARYRTARKAVNVSIVIDKSGSMSGSKIELVKKAIINFIEQLSPEDYFSLIQFDTHANTLIESRQLGTNINLIKNQINSIYAGGSTNLNAGMIKGYEEALKNHSDTTSSRIILLTDGMTNKGETNYENILENSKVFNDKGIEISTIGVGSALDFDLLRQLAIEGNGSNHFIGENEDDIQKVFIDEAQSLLYLIGKNPKVEIQLPKQFEILDFYGYQPKFFNDNKISIPIENLTAGSTQIMLVKVKTKANNGKINATLNYIDPEKEEQKITVNFKYNALLKTTNNEVIKNYHLAFMAYNLKKALEEYENSNYGNVQTILRKTKTEINKYNYNDIDIDRVSKIIDRYININQPTLTILDH